MLTIVWKLLTSRFGGWIVGGLAIAAMLVVLKIEHNAKLKAQGEAAAARLGMQIGYEGYVELYQEREEIKAKADQQRRKINELRKTSDPDGIVDLFNNPGGVRRPVQPNPQGGTKAPARYHTSGGTPTEYFEAP